MTDIDPIVSVVAQYTRFGWKLERILLSNASIELRSRLASEFQGIQILDHPLNALWFSRPQNDSVTWEIRRLTGSPFALLAVFNSEMSEDQCEKVLQGLEVQMAKTSADVGGEIPLEK
jgi:hypothetical protein